LFIKIAKPKLKKVRKATYNGCLKYLNAPVVINLFPLTDGGKNLILQIIRNTASIDKLPKTEYLRKSLSVIWSVGKDFSIKENIINSYKLINNPLGPVPNIFSYVFIYNIP